MPLAVHAAPNEPVGRHRRLALQFDAPVRTNGTASEHSSRLSRWNPASSFSRLGDKSSLNLPVPTVTIAEYLHLLAGRERFSLGGGR